MSKLFENFNAFVEEDTSLNESFTSFNFDSKKSYPAHITKGMTTISTKLNLNIKRNLFTKGIKYLKNLVSEYNGFISTSNCPEWDDLNDKIEALNITNPVKYLNTIEKETKKCIENSDFYEVDTQINLLVDFDESVIQEVAIKVNRAYEKGDCGYAFPDFTPMEDGMPSIGFRLVVR